MNIQQIKQCKCGKEIDKRSLMCKSCSNVSRGSWGKHSEETKLQQSNLMKILLEIKT